MAPKKNEKDAEPSKAQKAAERLINYDHEMFLQAFEKPTQIYRYLRTRNVISPVFVNRTLSYMRHRMSRSHKSRKDFKVDSMLYQKMNKTRVEKMSPMGKYLTLIFMGFYDKTLNINNETANVEVDILRLEHNKRKDSSASVQFIVGNAEIFLNPPSTITKVPALSISSESLSPKISAAPVSFILLFKIQINTDSNAKANTNNIENVAQEPVLKKQKLNGTTKYYQAELEVFNKNGRCQLADGEYELNVQELDHQQMQLQKYNSPKKNSSWETIEFKKSDVADAVRTLTFHLQWTKDESGGVVDRPTPIIVNCNNNNISNKENHKPDNSALNVNQNNNSIDKTIQENGTAVTKFTEGINIQQIIYQFVYNFNSRQQTEGMLDFHCPWCSLNCQSLYPLIKHLKLCHARFNFSYVPIPNGARIDVSINELYDASYNGSPHDLLGSSASFIRRGPVRRTVVTNILVCRPRKQKHSISEFLEAEDNELESQRPFITGHNRLYYHTSTCLPVHPKDLDVDSEGESDPLWLQYKTKQMIDEFSDVNEGEKELMKMWNLHIMKYGFVGDVQIPLACSMFVDLKGKELLEKNLYRNFGVHLSSLFDFGLISPECVQKMFRKIQKILFDNPNLQQKFIDTRKEQREIWVQNEPNRVAQPVKKEQHVVLGNGPSTTKGLNSSGSATQTEKKTKPATPMKNNHLIEKKGLPRRRSTTVTTRKSLSNNKNVMTRRSSNPPQRKRTTTH